MQRRRNATTKTRRHEEALVQERHSLRAFYVEGRCQASTLRSFSMSTLSNPPAAEAGPPPKSGACVGGARMSVNPGVVCAVRRATPGHPSLLILTRVRVKPGFVT